MGCIGRDWLVYHWCEGGMHEFGLHESKVNGYILHEAGEIRMEYYGKDTMLGEVGLILWKAVENSTP